MGNKLADLLPGGQRAAAAAAAAQRVEPAEEEPLGSV